MNEPQVFAGHDMDYVQNCLELKDSEFKEAFWDWFDELAPKEKHMFENYREDMAKLFFLNRVWLPSLPKKQ